MDQYEAVIKLLIEAVKESVSEGTDDTIPVGVSNRHVHLSQKDLETLFGPGYELAKMKDLSQPGQYACKETVTICGPKGAIEKSVFWARSAAGHRWKSWQGTALSWA